MRDALLINFLLVTEDDRFEREDGFARLVHRLDLVLVTRGRDCHAKLTTGVHNDYRACNCSTINPGDKGGRLALRADAVGVPADADGVGLASNTLVTDIDIIIARGEVETGCRA